MFAFHNFQKSLLRKINNNIFIIIGIIFVIDNILKNTNVDWIFWATIEKWTDSSPINLKSINSLYIRIKKLNLRQVN